MVISRMTSSGETMRMKHNSLFFVAMLLTVSMTAHAEPERTSALAQDAFRSVTCDAGTFKISTRASGERTEITSIVWRGKKEEKIRESLNRRLHTEVVDQLDVHCVRQPKAGSISVPQVLIGFQKKPDSNASCTSSLMLVFWRNAKSNIQVMGGLDCA